MIEVVVATALITLYVIYLFHRPSGASLPWRLISLVCNTLIVFGFLVAWFRRSWRDYRFWIAIGVLLLSHMLLLGFFTRSRSLPTAFYALVINPIELLVFAKILKRVLPGPAIQT